MLPPTNVAKIAAVKIIVRIGTSSSILGFEPL
jgi:hypothetical protein